MTPQSEQVHHWSSIKVPQFKQFQPNRPRAGSNGVADGPLNPLAGGGRGRFEGKVPPVPNRLLCGIGCGGCSSPQASQARYSRGLRRVHCGQDHFEGSLEITGDEGEAGYDVGDTGCRGGEEGGGGGSSLLRFRYASSASEIKRGVGRVVDVGREFEGLGRDAWTSRDTGRP